MKFRKKPIVIEAVLFKGYYNHFPSWARDAIVNTSAFRDDVTESKFWVKTLEGRMCCSYGDWLIRGIKGEVYPCKPDIFDATYERVEE